MVKAIDPENSTSSFFTTALRELKVLILVVVAVVKIFETFMGRYFGSGPSGLAADEMRTVPPSFGGDTDAGFSFSSFLRLLVVAACGFDFLGLSSVDESRVLLLLFNFLLVGGGHERPLTPWEELKF